MCWIGHGEVLPRDVPANAKRTLCIARINQNHFVPLRRSRKRDGKIPLYDTSRCKAEGYVELNLVNESKKNEKDMTQSTSTTKHMKELNVTKKVVTRKETSQKIWALSKIFKIQLMT